MEYQDAIDWVDDRISKSPGKVILVFLLLTAFFFTGLGNIESESGQDQFIEDLPSFEALEDVQRDFGGSFSESGSSTTVLLDSPNAVSKQGVLRTLRAQKRLEEYAPLRVDSTRSPAETVAKALDPEATTLFEMINAVESATQGEVQAAVRSAAEGPGFGNDVSEDFNAGSASATAARISVSHSSPDPPDERGERVRRVLASVDGDFLVIGDQPSTNTGSLLVILPAALLFITLFLIVAYRDIIDLFLGLFSIGMTLVWTFGFLGIAGIPFSVLVVSVPPLLIAVGIDFGIHSVNRYREERADGASITESMRLTTDQLLVAFFIVTGTSAIGFLSNLASAFPPTRNFGLTAAVGIVFTFLIFGVFLPAQKVYVDRLRERLPVPEMSSSPLGSEGSSLGRVLGTGVTVAEKAPAIFLVAVLIFTAAFGVYASGVETGFDPDDFLPPEETPEYFEYFPDPIQPPAEYQYVKNTNFQDENFNNTDQVLMYVEGPMQKGGALQQMQAAEEEPPLTFEREGRTAKADSISDVIRSVAEQDEGFRRLVERNDEDGDGVPDSNLGEVYDALKLSPAGGQVDSFLSEGRQSARVTYSVDGQEPDAEITEDAYEVADGYRYDASPTGFAIIFNEATNLIFETVVQSLVLSLAGAAVFLVIIYWVLEGKPALGIVNTVPILTTVILVVATMRFLGVRFNAINGGILAITIGLGIDYSVHVVHRFADEFEKGKTVPALRRTVIGTGGALTGSMLTTVFGVGVVGLALNPALSVFGILTASSVFYAYLTSIFVLPTVIMVWERYVGFRG